MSLAWAQRQINDLIRSWAVECNHRALVYSCEDCVVKNIDI